MLRRAARWILAAFFVAAGANHFVMTPVYLGMMPPWLPGPEAANVVSGVAEILGGLGLLLPPWRRAAGWGLVALLVAVFPANVHVARQGFMPGTDFSPAALRWRLPAQALLVLAVGWAALPGRRARPVPAAISGGKSGKPC